MGHGKGGRSKPHTERTEPARRKLGPGKQRRKSAEQTVSVDKDQAPALDLPAVFATLPPTVNLKEWPADTHRH